MSENEDTEINWSTTKIVWHCEVPNIQDIEQKILVDCKRNLWGLSTVSSLIFHHVFLGEDYDTDVVTVWGEEGSEDLHCEYEPTVTWSNIKDE